MSWKDNIYFILIEPKEAGNIGASARALKNMGFKNLRIVRSGEFIVDEARWLAHNALDVLEAALRFDSFADAVSDMSFVAGTTRRKGRTRGIFMELRDAAAKISAEAVSNKVAVVFGRESRGLLNEEVDECGFLITIPANREQPSLNLAQAVLLTAYELSMSGRSSLPEDKKSKDKRVCQEELQRLYSRTTALLRTLEYIPKGNLDMEKKIMVNIKHFVGRSGITDWELKMLHGIITRIERILKLKADGRC
ncbi:MAG: RNA methyltransferase [Nitrospirae bacterium]|nr:MAG: RNA methyltransferase [Nitrospirota bacterium]